MATKFRALAAPIDVSTGDQRRFAPGALTVAPTPLPLRWTPRDVGAHGEAVVIGRIDKVEMSNSEIWVEGALFTDIDPEKMPRLTEDVAHAMTLVREGVLGLSVDLDDFDYIPVKEGTDEPIEDVDFDDPDLRIEMLITKGRLRAATLVDMPAYVETNHTFELYEDDEAEAEPDDPAEDDDPEFALVAALSGDTSLPVLEDREHEWDGPAAAGRVLDDATDEDGTIDKTKASKAFLWVDGEGQNRGDYRLGFADLIDGELRIVPRGVAATAGGRGVDATDLPDSDKEAIKGHICSLYAKVRDVFDDWPECPFDDDSDDDDDTESASQIEALTAAEGAGVYPIGVFSAPVEITGPTPMTYDWENGVVYGHVAAWGTCHQGFPDSCVLAPRAPGGVYREFHVHRVETDEGTVYAGRITAGGRHPSSRDASIHAHHVRQHHDAMATVAYVVAKEDDYGIFVCGPLLPVDTATKKIVARRKVSPDWRETVDGLSMVEVLALKDGPKHEAEPGYPIQFSFHRGRQIALTAALGPRPEDENVTVQQVFQATVDRMVAARISEEFDKIGKAAVLRGQLDGMVAAYTTRQREALTQLIGE